MTRSPSPRALVALVALLAASACGPKVAPQTSPTAPVTAYDQKLRWILQLEDERQLRGGGGDLLAMLQDGEGRVRRRAGARYLQCRAGLRISLFRERKEHQAPRQQSS